MAEDVEKSEAQPRRRLSRWKKLVFGLIVAALFFGILEVILGVAGVKPLLYEDDPYVGFASNIPLFVEEGDRLVTAVNKKKWFNEQSFPVDKDSEARRIFCMGGSTTFGRPFRDKTSFCGWLRAYLPAADSSKSWELVNAGGISYASYRVAALMEELVDYDPDLFIIYSGHNEFLEERTYGDLMEMPSAIRGIQAGLAHSRVYSLLARMVKGEKPSTEASKLGAEVNTILDRSVGPEAYTRNEELKKQVLAHYRFNLARMVDIARAADARVVFVTPAANLRNSSPFKSEHRAGLSKEDLEKWEAHMAKARTSHKAGDKQAALTAIDLAVGMDPRHAESHYLRGRILEVAGKAAEAKLAYTLALEEDICPLRMLGEMRTILNEVAKDRDVPVVDFHKIMEERSEHGIPGEKEFLDHVHPTIESHRLLALALVDELAKQAIASKSKSWNEDTIKAATAKVMAGVDDNERGIALRNLANVLQWAGKYEDAYVAAKKSLALTPGDAYANFVTGDLAEKLGLKDEARERYQFLTGFKVSTKDAPYFIETHYKYAGLLLDKGDFRGSIAMLRKTLELKPGHKGAAEALPLTLQDWGMRLLKGGKGKEAVEPLEQFLREKPADLNVKNWLGIALIQAGRPQDAIPHLLSVVRANASNPAILNNLATAYAQTGQKEEALRYFLETVKIDPSHAGAITNLGELYLEAGDLDKAQQFFVQALTLQPGNPALSERIDQIKARRAAAKP